MVKNKQVSKEGFEPIIPMRKSNFDRIVKERVEQALADYKADEIRFLENKIEEYKDSGFKLIDDLKERLQRLKNETAQTLD